MTKQLIFETNEEVYNHLQKLKLLSESRDLSHLITKALGIYEYLLKCTVGNGKVHILYEDEEPLEINIL